MRPILAILLWLVTVGVAWADSTIHFVTLAGIKPGKEAQYDAFIEAVTPIWKRHGMTIVARARPVAPFTYHEGPVDLAVLRVKTRTGFYAYASDPGYLALQPERLDAVNFLVIFDGTVETANKAKLSESAALRVWFVSQPGAAWAKMLATDLETQDRAGLKIDLGIVGPVKGTPDGRVLKTRTIHVEALEDKSPGQPPYLSGLHVVTGPRHR